ncbi:MAG: hypothetical protein CME71_02145 [Halobacteriovorax sp.]|nr:hypothetical protein [Halobacteriovorax sp.]
MGKPKTLKKHDDSKRERPQATLWDPTENTTLEGLKECMKEAPFEDDIETFQGGLLILLEHYDYKDIIEKTGLSKSTLYRMCHPDSNPTLSNVCKVLAYISQASVKSA